MRVETILESKGRAVETVPEDMALADAVALLERFNIGALVVIDRTGQVAGILSERDIVRRLAGEAADALSLSVGACMTRDVVTCTRDTALDTLMEQMTVRRIRHIPVLENGALVGIVSIGDVVKRKIEEAEHEALSLREYIAS